MSAGWNWLTRHRRAALVAAVLAVPVWWFSAYPRGVAASWVDAARGHDEVQVYGKPFPWDGEYRRLARERYGVEINPVAGCLVTPELVSYVDGYNSVSVPRIRERFGKDIFAECEAEARAACGREHPRE